MTENILLALAAVVALGILAQWIAWRFHVPAILLLLVTGFVVGPVVQVIERVRGTEGELPRLDPDGLLGDLLIPIVSASVAIILFEGGLSLSVRELKATGSVLWRLVTIGAVATWGIGAFAGMVAVGLSTQTALLIGAILVVTGPTVVGPLLRNVRPTGAVGSILRWEGILIDPIGAVLAVLVFEAILVGQRGDAASAIVAGILTTAGVGSGVGLLAAVLIIVVIKRYLIPDFLHNAVSLSVVLAAFTAANEWVAESGLVAVTVMGIALANQRITPVRHIIEFKETLRVLLISGLFVLLAAKLDVDQVLSVGWGGLVFLGIIIAGRPVAVVLSTVGSKLSRNERIFLATVAPRGIIAAAIPSVFVLEMTRESPLRAAVLEIDKIVPLSFIVIVGTIVFSGLVAPRVARRLALSDREPQGAIIVGANPIARALASALVEEDFRVELVDNDWGNVSAARMVGLPTHYRSFLAEEVNHQVDLGGIGRLFAVTSNDELNALSVQHALHLFGRASVFQLASREGGSPRTAALAAHQKGRILFAEGATYAELVERVERGATIKKTPLSEEFGMDDFRERYGESALPLFLVSPGKLTVFSVDGKPTPKPGDKLISLVEPEARSDERPGGSTSATTVSAGAPAAGSRARPTGA